MRYMIKKKIWSFGGEFAIRDADEREVFWVNGKVFSWGNKLSFQDADRREVAFISQKLMSLKPRYEIHRGDQKFAEVVKEYSWFKKKFTLDVPGPNDYRITGSFWDHEYTFERDAGVVATVSKAFWSWSDTYGVDVIEGEDDAAILATCIVIALVCHDEQ